MKHGSHKIPGAAISFGQLYFALSPATKPTYVLLLQGKKHTSIESGPTWTFLRAVLNSVLEGVLAFVKVHQAHTSSVFCSRVWVIVNALLLFGQHNRHLSLLKEDNIAF